MRFPEPISTQTQEQEIFKNMFSVASGVWRIKDIFVNMYIVSTDNGWVLVDAGLKTSYGMIKKLSTVLFGADSRPDAIVLTHAHFDHVGSIKALAEEWNVSVIAHPLEIPYLTGQSKYPPADPTVGGGIMVYMSWTFPRGSSNIGSRAVPLAGDGTISSMPGWRWIHTPGHTPGHVSYYREEDGCLIVGDAFVTTDQRKATYVARQRREMHGPPPYFTTDWKASAASVKELSMLKPKILATGHGKSFYGTRGQKSLDKLARQFFALAVPRHGRYVNEPALADDEGVYYIPKNGPHQRKVYALAGLVALGLISIVLSGVVWNKKRKKHFRH
jgi:glyoxylase-like metal-dependent hydrolase (beta-lactamase superfamily II)